HSGSSHFVNPQPWSSQAIISFNIPKTGAFQHGSSLFDHVFSHLKLVLLEFSIKGYSRQPPVIQFIVIQGHFVFMIRKGFSKAHEPHGPASRFNYGFLEFFTIRCLCNAAGPVTPSSTSLISITPGES